MRQKQTGFTIVELLIVIVVIGILAAITVVAYNGVQARAATAKKQSDIAQIQKKFAAYLVLNEQYPDPLDAGQVGDVFGANFQQLVYTPVSGEDYCDRNTTFTKKQYCVESWWTVSPTWGLMGGYLISWWNDQERRWVGVHANIDDDREWSYTEDYGDGEHPEPPTPN